MSIRVIARARAKKGHEAAVRALMLELVEPTRREEGCKSYHLLESPGDPTDLVMLEEWASDAALDAHLKVPGVTAIIGRLVPLLAAPPEITRYKLVR
jgi:quinol monooxygenase YgiN